MKFSVFVAAMSHIAIALEMLMKEKKKTGVDIERATGLNKSQISRWKNGDQYWISREDLLNLAKGFDNTSQTHGRLLLARLKDVLYEPGARHIKITANFDEMNSLATSRSQIILSPSLERDIELIRQRAFGDKQMKNLVHAIARMAERKELKRARRSSGSNCKKIARGSNVSAQKNPPQIQNRQK
ncbi:MAG: helix-turn-helix domain-containing protein [Limisphaerales bacterium]